MIHKGNLHFPPYESIRGIHTFSPYEIISGTAKNAVPPLWHHKGILFFFKKIYFLTIRRFFFWEIVLPVRSVVLHVCFTAEFGQFWGTFFFFFQKNKKKTSCSSKKKPLWGNWVLHSVCGKFHSNLNQSSKNTLNMPLFFPNIFHKIQ